MWGLGCGVRCGVWYGVWCIKTLFHFNPHNSHLSLAYFNQDLLYKFPGPLGMREAKTPTWDARSEDTHPLLMREAKTPTHHEHARASFA